MRIDVDDAAAWAEVVSETYVPVTASSLDARDLHASLDVVRLPDGIATYIDASASRIERTRSLITSSSEDEILFSVQVAGGHCVQQRGRLATVNPGAGVVYTSDFPYTLTAGEPCSTYVLQVHRSRIGLSRSRMAELSARTLPSEDPSLKLFVSVLDTILTANETALVDVDTLGRTATDMLAALLWRLASGSTGLSNTERSLLEARDFITRNLTDPRLDVPYLAAHLGVSKRSLYAAFASVGTSPAEYVRQQRTRVAAARLLSSQLPITDIAIGAGFGDPATFTRAFRRTFGITPAKYRSTGGNRSHATLGHAEVVLRSPGS